VRIAVIAITGGGAEISHRLKDALAEEPDVYVSAKAAPADCDFCKETFSDLADTVKKTFGGDDGIVFVMAAGIVVRLIAPHLEGKLTDPAVVVVDEAGRHAISLLSGHVGGANELAGRVAEAIGATPVITTATDVSGKLGVDMLAMRLGCVVEDYEAAKRVTAAIVNGKRVALYASTGADGFAGLGGELSGNVSLLFTPDDIAMGDYAAAILVTPHTYGSSELGGVEHVAYLRPKSLVVGLGCNRGTPPEEFGRMLDGAFERYAISPLSISNLATVADKHDEDGLIMFAESRGLTIDFIDKARLNETEPPSGRSSAAEKHLGVHGVCEPAALISAARLGHPRLIVPKQKSPDVTLAVAEAT